MTCAARLINCCKTPLVMSGATRVKTCAISTLYARLEAMMPRVMHYLETGHQEQRQGEMQDLRDEALDLAGKVVAAVDQLAESKQYLFVRRRDMAQGFLLAYNPAPARETSAETRERITQQILNIGEYSPV